MKLAHPSLCKVLDCFYFEELSVFIVVLEHLRNSSDYIGLLSEFCGEEASSEPEKLRLAIDLGHALAYLHQRGIVMNALKPDNILVHKTRRPMLLDFGISQDGLLACIKYHESV